MVGTDVSEPNLNEAREVISRFQRTNVRIEQVPAFELTDHFGENEFDVCVSIDVVEHLHPEDAKEHYRQVYHILKPGGKYIVIMPNRIGGPHDVTLEEFPEAKEALGFHLNESTYRETTQIMGEIGFVGFRQIFGVKLPRMGYVPILLPCWLCVWAEGVFGGLLGRFRNNLIARVVAIRLIGYKRSVREVANNRS
jgi:SAM-dependent methyltransferase